MATVELALDVGAMGARALATESPADLTVMIDPSMPSPTATRVTCTPDATLEICNDRFPVMRGALRTDLSLAMRFVNRDLVAEALWLEILMTSSGLAARLFARNETDAAPPSPPAVCPSRRIVSTSGMLRLSTMDFTAPDMVHGVLEAQLTDGGILSIEF